MVGKSEKIGLFYADVATWRRRVASMLTSTAQQADATAADSHIPSDKKNLTRCRIIDNSGNTLTLSVPMSHSATAELSNHGRWQNMHLNALRTIYGRAPYFAHIMPLLIPLYQLPLPTPATEFFTAGEKLFMQILNLPRICTDLNQMTRERSNLYNQLTAYWRPRLTDQSWIGDALFRFGPESIWGLLPVNIEYCL